MSEKSLRLSHSQINTFQECNYKWWLHYIEKIRPSFLSSPLYFGTNLDNTIEKYLLGENRDYREEYLEQIRNFEVNGKKKQLPEDILSVRFGAGDCDDKLIDQSKLDKYCEELELEPVKAKDFLEYCKQLRKKKKAYSEVEQKLFNYCAFLTLQEKGLLLLEKLVEWIDENVVEVIAVQKKIEIENDNGDKFIGYLDFVVRLKTDCKRCLGTGWSYDDSENKERPCEYCNPRVVLIDLKTSSNPKLYYPEDVASKSRQLGIYSQEEGIPDVAYLVADKSVRVREPRVRLSFIEGIITEEHLDEVFAEIEQVTEEIKEKLPKGEKAFEKNLDSCNNFGGCWARGFCKSGSMKNLEKVK